MAFAPGLHTEADSSSSKPWDGRWHCFLVRCVRACVRGARKEKEVDLLRFPTIIRCMNSKEHFFIERIFDPSIAVGTHVCARQLRIRCPALYVSVPLATCVGLCRFGEAWAALRAENLLTYLSKAHMDSWINGSMMQWQYGHGAPLPGLDHAPEHVHVEALAGHQLAQESNLLQAAADALKATRCRRSGR